LVKVVGEPDTDDGAVAVADGDVLGRALCLGVMVFLGVELGVGLGVFDGVTLGAVV
jgi:hypothetical protein